MTREKNKGPRAPSEGEEGDAFGMFVVESGMGSGSISPEYRLCVNGGNTYQKLLVVQESTFQTYVTNQIVKIFVERGIPTPFYLVLPKKVIRLLQQDVSRLGILIMPGDNEEIVAFNKKALNALTGTKKKGGEESRGGHSGGGFTWIDRTIDTTINSKEYRRLFSEETFAKVEGKDEIIFRTPEEDWSR